MNAGYSPIPNQTFLQELTDSEIRDGFVADHVRVRLALLIRTLREQRGWSQAELGRRLGKPQSVVSRLEDTDYGRLSLQTIFEVAAAFGLPVYIDLPNWEEWFRLMEDMSARSFQRAEFDAQRLAALSTPPPVAAEPAMHPDVLTVLTQLQNPQLVSAETAQEQWVEPTKLRSSLIQLSGAIKRAPPLKALDLWSQAAP